MACPKSQSPREPNIKFPRIVYPGILLYNQTSYIKSTKVLATIGHIHIFLVDKEIKTDSDIEHTHHTVLSPSDSSGIQPTIHLKDKRTMSTSSPNQPSQPTALATTDTSEGSGSASATITAGTFTIHYFASASAYTGKTTESLPTPLPLRELFNFLERRYPGFRAKVLGSCSVSLGLEYVDVVEDGGAGDVLIGDGEEVGIIPPVSSG
jgi:molybdopterin converting factor small subunit